MTKVYKPINSKYIKTDGIYHNRTLLSSYLDNINSKINTNISTIKQLSSRFVGEFVLFEGNKYYTSNNNWQYLGEYYNPKNFLLADYPITSGYTRKYKIRMDYTDNVTNNSYRIYLRLENNGTALREFLFPITWGGAADGMRRTSTMDFDISYFGSGHVQMYITPSFAAGSGIPFRIYKVSILIYDILE